MIDELIEKHLSERENYDFEKKVETVYQAEARERFNLKKEIEKINNIETLKKIYIESFDILKHNHDMYMDLKNKSFLSKILVQIAND